MSSVETITPHAIPTDTSREIRVFVAIFAVMIVGSLIWGLTAHLDAGAIAQGEVIPAGRVRTVQHLEGGIIRSIEVKDGDRVKVGDPLLQLDDTDAKANLSIALTNLAGQKALLDRLRAERDGRTYQPDANAPSGPAISGQVRLFETRKSAFNKALAGIQQQVLDARQESAAWEAKNRSLQQIAENTQEENRINQSLYERNFISKPRLLQLKNASAQNQAMVGENLAEISRAKQKISDGEVAIAKMKGDWLNGILEELRRAEDTVAELQEKTTVAQSRLDRTKVVAPQNGYINGLKYATTNGVIPPGGAILDIVPDMEKMVVEARLSPDDVDVVSPNQKAQVRLSAYKARSHILLDGTVISVSKNTFHDDNSPNYSYYKVRVELPTEELKKVEGPLTPGMLAEVHIVSGSRLAIRYLLDPLLDSFRRAFKES